MRFVLLLLTCLMLAPSALAMPGDPLNHLAGTDSRARCDTIGFVLAPNQDIDMLKRKRYFTCNKLMETHTICSIQGFDMVCDFTFYRWNSRGGDFVTFADEQFWLRIQGETPYEEVKIKGRVVTPKGSDEYAFWLLNPVYNIRVHFLLPPLTAPENAMVEYLSTDPDQSIHFLYGEKLRKLADGTVGETPLSN